MNISYLWLRDLAPTIAESPREVADRLASLGAPVDEIVELGAGLRDVVIAKVEEVAPHPNADRLRLCRVNTGGEELLQVVCGAPNVAAGSFYPFAPIGATLPGEVSIRKAKLRGEVSEGMLCSARELGLGRDHAGLLTLRGEWEPGASLVESLALDDVRLVVDVTANRPDLLSHWGVAREVAPGGIDDLRLPPFTNAAPVLELHRQEREGSVGGVRVRLDDPEACPRYLAAVVRGVRVESSPEWLAMRLRSIGIRPINNVVDATNYVLFELGQPLHAFDLDRLAGEQVRVRRAEPGETIRTLDGVDRTLGEGMLVIADAERPVAIAGLMGGEESEVTSKTTELFLECAIFDPRSVRHTRRTLGMSTDASYRFERGVDPEAAPRALKRLVDLIVAVAGGESEPDALDLNPSPFEPAAVTLRPERIERLLGVPFASDEVEDLLHPIGFRVRSGESSLVVEVPAFRPDVTREIDLIEEIARRRGYDRFPERLRPFRPSAVPEDPLFAVQRRVHEIFARWGFWETRTAAFAPAAEEAVPLLNPLSTEESHLRRSLIPGLLRRVEHNWARGTRDVRLYDMGTVFAPVAGGVPREQVRLAAVFTGASRPPHWSGDAAAWDVWDLKALLDELADRLGLGEAEPGEPADNALFAAGEQLRIAQGEGGGGRVVSDAVDAPPWAAPLWALELVLPEALPDEDRTFVALPEHPAVERDLALLLPAAVTAAEIREVIEATEQELLESAEPFDLYAGPGIPEGMRSLAWRLRFRTPGRTLTDPQADAAQGAILRALDERLSVRRR